MRGKGYDQHYRNIAPPTSGLLRQRGQLTSVQRNKAKLGFNCDHCGLPFETYACWAKRYANHYCGRACAWAAKVIRIPKPCAACGIEMLLKPSGLKRVSACSKVCQRKRRTTTHQSMRSSPDYTAIVKRLKNNMVCSVCSTTNGPWVVSGIKTWVADGLACANGDSAHLVCKHCHLKAAAPLAATSTYMKDRFKFYKERSPTNDQDIAS